MAIPTREQLASMVERNPDYVIGVTAGELLALVDLVPYAVVHLDGVKEIVQKLATEIEKVTP